VLKILLTPQKLQKRIDMSQFTLTAQEDLLVLGAVRARAAQYLSSMGVADLELDALVDKIQSQFNPVVEPAPAVTEVVEPEVVVYIPEETTEEVVAAEETPAKE
jgi:hypothetical protein